MTHPRPAGQHSGATAMDQFLNTIGNIFHNVVSWFANLVPGTGFGLLLIPLIALGLVSLWVSRR